MHPLTIHLPDMIHQALAGNGVATTEAQEELVFRLLRDYLEDVRLLREVREAEQGGYVGPEAGERWLSGLRDAED